MLSLSESGGGWERERDDDMIAILFNFLWACERVARGDCGDWFTGEISTDYVLYFRLNSKYVGARDAGTEEYFGFGIQSRHVRFF